MSYVKGSGNFSRHYFLHDELTWVLPSLKRRVSIRFNSERSPPSHRSMLCRGLRKVNNESISSSQRPHDLLGEVQYPPRSPWLLCVVAFSMQHLIYIRQAPVQNDWTMSTGISIEGLGSRPSLSTEHIMYHRASSMISINGRYDVLHRHRF